MPFRHHRLSFRSLLATALAAGLLSTAVAAQTRDDPGPGDNDNPDTVNDLPAAPGDFDWGDMGLLPGARHKVQHFEWLGRAVDEEAVPSADDNMDGHGNDDDGLFGFGYQPGPSGMQVVLRVQLHTQLSDHPAIFPFGSQNFIDAWIDWDKDGVYEHPAEYVGTVALHGPYAGPFGPDSVTALIIGQAKSAPADEYNVRLRVDWHDVGNTHTPSPAGEADGNINPPSSFQLTSFGETEDYRPTDPWYIRALGKPGSSTAQARLSGSGPATAGSSNQILLEYAKPNASAFLILGLTRIEVPFKGGTLVPAPDFILPLTTDANGKLTLPFVLDPAIPAGTKLYLQTWIVDAVSFGWASSNGLRLMAK